MVESLRDIEAFPDHEVYGVKQISAQLMLAIRYTHKLDDYYLCAVCKKPHEGDETVQHFKARVHLPCYAEIHGQEKLDKVLRIQRELTEDG